MSKKLLTFLLSACTVMVVVMLLSKTAPDTTPVEPAPKPLCVGAVFVSPIRDGGWSEAHYNGLLGLENMGVRLLCRENVSDRDNSVVAAVDGLAREGAKVIFTTSVDYGPYMLQCAKNHPEIMFYHCTGMAAADNLATYMGRIYQARYLTGIAAGLRTKTDEIGYVASFPIPEVIRGINAFTLGARSVNPDVRVHVEWTGAWEFPEAETAAVNRLLSQPIDVLAQHQNTATPVAALEAAGRRDVLAVGYNLDRSGDFPDVYLTAAVWNWGAFYESRIEEYLIGQFSSRNYWEGIETGMVGIAPLKDPELDNAMERIEAAKARMLTGAWDVFYGPIRDSNGQLRVQEGEALPDDYLLRELDWFVEGVDCRRQDS